MSKHKSHSPATHHKSDHPIHPHEPSGAQPPEHHNGNGQAGSAVPEPMPAITPQHPPAVEAPDAVHPAKAGSAPGAAGVSPQDQMSGCLVRLLWMLVANAALLICLKFILSNHESLLSWADALFWAIAGLAIGLRYLDVKKLQGRTATGKPATLGDWRRYSLLLLGICAVAWLAAHAWAYWAGSVH